jgi:hypothetical protein
MKKLVLLFICIFICFSFPSNTYAQELETGWTMPFGTGAGSAYNIGGAQFAGDYSYTVFDNSTDDAFYFYFTNVNVSPQVRLAIPPEKVIKGIEVSLLGFRTESSDLQFRVCLTGDNYLNLTEWKTTTGLLSSSTKTSTELLLGSPDDTWGLWSYTHIDESNFSVKVSVSGTTGEAWLDAVRVKVYYCDPVSPFVIKTSGKLKVPSEITSITAKAWGGGGGGTRYIIGMYSGAGGGGGGFVKGTLTANSGEIFDITVGRGGLGGGANYTGEDGSKSEVSCTSGKITANGGKAGNDNVAGASLGGAGSASGEVLNVSSFTGGNGASGTANAGGGGGGGAGDGSNGYAASGETGGAGGTNYGGTGGNGSTVSDNATNGLNYGGGGGGSRNESSAGNGANGAVILSWGSTPCPGSAVGIDFENGVTNSEYSLGQPDNNVAILYYEQGGQLTLDLTGEGGIIAPGNTVTILWRKNSDNDPLVEMELTNEITGHWETVTDGYYVKVENLTGYSFTVTADTRYLSILIDGTGGEILEIDAVTYTCSCTAPTPTVSVENFCGYSILTANNYEGELTWSTGESTPSIMVYDGGIYTVSQKVGECLSLSGSGLAVPYVVPGNPGTISGPESPCDGANAVYSINAVSNATGYAWTVPEGWIITVGENTESITVNVGTNTGNVSVKATSNNCESPESSLSVTPDLICCTQGQSDRFEDNNTLQTAALMKVVDPVIYANILDSKDADWFYFVTGNAGLYKINYVPGSTAEIMALYNSSARKLKPAERTGTTYSLLGVTNYYIKVSTRLKSPAPCYSLGVEMLSSALFASEQFDDTKSAEIETTPDGICKIWPNPTKNEFQIYNGNEYPIQMKVMDVTGRQIEIVNNVGIAETAAFGSKYKPGIYFVKTSENGVPKVFKVIKQ